MVRPAAAKLNLLNYAITLQNWQGGPSSQLTKLGRIPAPCGTLGGLGLYLAPSGRCRKVLIYPKQTGIVVS